MRKLNRTFFQTSCLVSFFLSCMIINVFSQHDKEAPPPFNEFTVSANRVIMYNDASNYIEKIGFGAGIYRFWFEPKRVNLIAGISVSLITDRFCLWEYSIKEKSRFFNVGFSVNSKINGLIIIILLLVMSFRTLGHNGLQLNAGRA